MSRDLLDRKEFEAKPERRWSQEWDFGVMWRSDGDDGRLWPLWRVSWVIDTGELYAVCHQGVVLLGIVPPVGDYPHMGSSESWHNFKNAQDIEKVMEGWAEGDHHKPLSWIEDRLRRFEEGTL